jgi:hypothetical protein
MTTIATYDNFESANEALEKLMEAGVSRGHISVAALEETSNKMNTYGMHISNDNNPIGDAVAGTTGGILSGAGLGGIIGLLTGVAALTIPGLGALLITGPLAAALGFSSLAANTVAGAAIGGTAAGVAGLAGGLTKAGLDAAHADKIQSTVQSGGVMLAVEDDTEMAQDILDTTNPNTLVTL